jgi:hypothetical protein
VTVKGGPPWPGYASGPWQRPRCAYLRLASPCRYAVASFLVTARSDGNCGGFELPGTPVNPLFQRRLFWSEWVPSLVVVLSWLWRCWQPQTSVPVLALARALAQALALAPAQAWDQPPPRALEAQAQAQMLVPAQALSQAQLPSRVQAHSQPPVPALSPARVSRPA